MTIQYKLKTDKGLFFISEINDQKIKITLLEDLTNQVFESDEEDHVLISSDSNPIALFNACEELHSSLIIKYRKENVETKKEQTIVDTFQLSNLLRNKTDCDQFLDNVLANGRAPVQLSNGSIIQACKPLLCFENKDKEFKEKRFLLEKKYWLKLQAEKENRTMQEQDMFDLSFIMIQLF